MGVVLHSNAIIRPALHHPHHPHPHPSHGSPVGFVLVSVGINATDEEESCLTAERYARVCSYCNHTMIQNGTSCMGLMEFILRPEEWYEETHICIDNDNNNNNTFYLKAPFTALKDTVQMYTKVIRKKQQ